MAFTRFYSSRVELSNSGVKGLPVSTILAKHHCVTVTNHLWRKWNPSKQLVCSICTKNPVHLVYIMSFPLTQCQKTHVLAFRDKGVNIRGGRLCPPPQTLKPACWSGKLRPILDFVSGITQTITFSEKLDPSSAHVPG